LGVAFLKPALGAYAAGRVEGNLFELLDAGNWMGERWELPNDELPGDFLNRMRGCRSDCGAPFGNCTTCEQLFERHARSRRLGLRDMRNSNSEGGGAKGA
jgi:hypothetical protein